MKVKSPKNKRGQGLVEYALIIMLIALVVIIGVQAMGGSLDEYYRERIVSQLESI